MCDTSPSGTPSPHRHGQFTGSHRRLTETAGGAAEKGHRGKVRISHGGTGRRRRIVLTSRNPARPATIAGLVYVPAGSDGVSVTHLRLNGRNLAELPSPIVDGDHVRFTYDNVTNRNSQSVCFIVGSVSATSAGFLAAHDRVHNCGDMRTRRDTAGDPHTAFYEHAFYLQNATRFRVTQTIMFTISGRCLQLYPDAVDGEIDHNLCDGAGTGVIVDAASSKVLITRNIFTNAVVQGGIAEGSTFAGSGDVAERNVLWHDHPTSYQLRGGGLTVTGNRVVAPIYVNRAARRYRLRRGSPAAGYGPARIQPRWAPAPGSSFSGSGGIPRSRYLPVNVCSRWRVLAPVRL